MNRFKYYLHKILGGFFETPVIPKGKTVGYSMIRSDRYHVQYGVSTKVCSPFYLYEVELGDYSYIAKNCSISHCSIGKFCSIGPNFCCGMGIHPTNGISTSPMFYSTARQNGLTMCSENKIAESKKTIIGNDVFIGANVTVLDGVRIEDGAVIGAGAVVTKDVPPYAVAVGVPAEVKRYRFDEKTIAELMESRWWDKGIDEYKRVECYFWEPDKFLHK
jgi:acetyltransferase-like isoleucine patch superfamily enzyme